MPVSPAAGPSLFTLCIAVRRPCQRCISFSASNQGECPAAEFLQTLQGPAGYSVKATVGWGLFHITDYLGTNNNESQEFGTPGGQYLLIQLYCAMAVSHVQSVLLGKKTCLLSQQ